MTSNMNQSKHCPKSRFLAFGFVRHWRENGSCEEPLVPQTSKSGQTLFFGWHHLQNLLVRPIHQTLEGSSLTGPWAHLWDWNIEKSPAHISKYILGIRLGRTGHWKRVRQELLNQIICQTPVRPSQGRHHLPRELISSTVQSSIKFYLTTQHLPKKGISKSRYSLFNWLIDLCFCYFKMTYLLIKWIKLIDWFIHWWIIFN